MYNISEKTKERTYIIMEFLNNFVTNKTFRVLIVAILFDMTFGILRAIKQRKINSCIGIDGMIRKAGMLLSSGFLYYLDFILALNFIAFIPEDIRNFINIEHIGIGSLFGILFIIFELLSALKNMYICELPIPSVFRNFLEKILLDYTNELKKGEK